MADADVRVPGVRVVGRPRLDERPALPAGHPETWGLLTAGTCLDGAAYPYPVFDVGFSSAAAERGPQ